AELTVSALLDRTRPGFSAWGLFGGGYGRGAAIQVKRAGDDHFHNFSEVYAVSSPSKFTNVRLRAGDEVLIESPGGGVFGDPRERDRDQGRHDAVEGFVSGGAGA